MTDPTYVSAHGPAPAPEEAPPYDRVRAIRRRMALAVLPTLPSSRLGSITLLGHQQQAAARLLRMLSWHRGALLSDDVGLGKTFTALAVAQRYEQVHVLAPAALVTMWQGAVLRTEQPHIRVHSLHRFSRQAAPPFRAVATNDGESARRPLVIVDEAHALRNPSTVRYRHLATAMTGCDVLLISATPLHNSPRDLQALFALFRGQRSDALRADVLASLIVRREQTCTRRRPPRSATDSRERTLAVAASRPVVRTHRPLVVPQDEHTLSLLLALPAPLPAHDGAVAGALIRLGLLRAWCSSDAALAQAIARRLQRGSAMRDALQVGRHPTGAELQTWVVGDDSASSMQLGFPELLIGHSVPETSGDQASFTAVLDRHLDALRALRDHHTTTARADAVRTAMLRTVRERHGGVPVVAFSQYSRTVQALFRALSDIAGVGMLTGTRARIASGAITRTEILEHFAPRAHGRPPPPAHHAVTLLLTTDLIAEGVNLQDAGVVVHLDLPWTHALRTQRTGRVARLGSLFRVVHEYLVQAAAPARRALRAEQRLAHKAALSVRYVGGASPGHTYGAGTHADTHVSATASAADQSTVWWDCLDRWAADEGAALGPLADHDAHAHTTRVAVLTHGGHETAALLLTASGYGKEIVAITRDVSRWRVSTRAHALLHVATLEQRVAAHGVASVGMAQDYERQLHRVVRQWSIRRRAHLAIGLGGGSATSMLRAPGAVQRRALAWLQRVTARLSPVQRHQQATQLAAARTCIQHAQGVAADEALCRWMRTRVDDPVVQLRGWQAHELLRRGMPTDAQGPGAAMERRAAGIRVLCGVLFVGTASAPPP